LVVDATLNGLKWHAAAGAAAAAAGRHWLVGFVKRLGLSQQLKWVMLVIRLVQGWPDSRCDSANLVAADDSELNI
jgi:hypothetical protein